MKKHGLLRNISCNYLDLTYAKSNSNSIIGNYRAIVCGFNCNKYNNTISECLVYTTIKNIHNNQKAARRHLRQYYQTINENINAFEENNIEESSEMHLAIEGDFDIIDLEKDKNYLNLITNLSNKIEIYREFIKHFTKETIREYLVAML